MKLYFVGFFIMFAGCLFPLEVKTEKSASEKLVEIMQRKSDADLASLEQSNGSAKTIRARRLEARAQKLSNLSSTDEPTTTPTQN